MSTTGKVVYESKKRNRRWELQMKNFGKRDGWYPLRVYKYLWRAKLEAWFLGDERHIYRVVDTQ